jgi:hypothetical protein
VLLMMTVAGGSENDYEDEKMKDVDDDSSS